MIHTIVDTDFGGDPDDILALTYLLNRKDVIVDAIFTNDEYKKNRRALILKKWLNSLQLDIPVFSGFDLGNTRLFVLDDVVVSQRSEKVYTLYEDTVVLKNTLTNMINKNGYYVSIGCLSNLSFLLQKDPNLMKKGKYLIMGGAFKYRNPGKAEHNVRTDLNSARNIFESDLEISWVLNDVSNVTELCITIESSIYTSLFTKYDFTSMLIKMNMKNFYSRLYPKSYLHDPVTVSCLFNNSIIFGTTHAYMALNGEFIKNRLGKRLIVSKKGDYKSFWSDFNNIYYQ